MNIVVTRKTSLGAETFARAMVGKNITLQKASSIKILMLNQFKGYINQISGLIRKPEKRYWIFNDGLGGAWRFDFVVYPVQQLVIICAFYAVAINRVLPQRQRSVAQQNEGKSNVMRLSEADLRYIVFEATRRIIKEYTDHPIFGWEHAKKKFKDGGATDEVIKKLKDAYDVYAQETASQGRIPNDTGFDLWCFDKEYQAQQQGIRNLYPDYLHSIN